MPESASTPLRQSTYFRSIIHKTFNNIQKAHKISAHLQLPRETKTTPTKLAEFFETGENTELSSQVLMRTVLTGNGEKYWKKSQSNSIDPTSRTEALRVRRATAYVCFDFCTKEKL